MVCHSGKDSSISYVACASVEIIHSAADIGMIPRNDLSCKSNFVNLTSCKWPNFIFAINFVIMLETASHE